MTIELRHLRCALAAADHGSFRRAAGAIGVRPSSVSRRIRDLEAMLNFKIFVRSSGGVQVTAPGQGFIAHAREALNCLTRARDVSFASPREERRSKCPDTDPEINTDNFADEISLADLAKITPSPLIAIIEALLIALRRSPIDLAPLPVARDAQYGLVRESSKSKDAELVDLFGKIGGNHLICLFAGGTIGGQEQLSTVDRR